MALCPPRAGRFGPRRGWRFALPRPGWFGPRRGWRSSSPAPGSSARAGDGALPPPPRVVRPAAGSGPFPKVRRAGGLATKNCATPLSASCEFFLGQLPLPRLHLLPPLPRFSLLGCVFRRPSAAPAAPGSSPPRPPHPPSHLPPPYSSQPEACSLSSGGSTGRKNSCQKSNPSLWACQGPGVISMLLPPFARPIPLTFLRE